MKKNVKNPGKTVLYESKEVITDYHTGEAVQQKDVTRSRLPPEPRYIKLYLQDILYFSDIPRQYEKVLYSLLQNAVFANQKHGMAIALVPALKKEICEELGWKSTQALDNALTALVKGRILIRLDRGFYRLNPFFFGIGNWEDIHELRLEINYNEIEGRTFKAVFNANKKQKEEKEEKQDEQTKLAV